MVGILALQGDFEKHYNILNNIGVSSLFVKNKDDLCKTKALIIPGGESTTLSILFDKLSLRVPIIEYSKKFSIFGTCAGMIMLSTTSKIKDKVKTLNIMDFSVSRNSWGAQIYSFEKKIDFNIFGVDSFNSVFIRAPKVASVGKQIIKKDFFKN